MSLYTHLSFSFAKRIIELANNGWTKSKINEETKVSKGKITRCLEKAKITTTKPNLQQPWKGPRIKVKYSWKKYKAHEETRKLKKAYSYAKDAERIYLRFIIFCKSLYEKRILGKKVKRSAEEYIKEFKKAYPNGDYPRKSWVYVMAKSIHYQFDPKWLPSSKKKVFKLKSDDERKKPVKYNSIDQRPDKAQLRSEPGNFEIDSVIGKKTDKQAALTLIDICTGKFYIRFYDRTMEGFRDALLYVIKKHKLNIKTLTMDNGGENNLLHEILPKEIMFNCHPYCSGEKGTLENVHRILRRIFYKSESLDKYKNKDLKIVNKFVNNYYSKVFNRI